MNTESQHCDDRVGRRMTKRVAASVGGALLTLTLLAPAAGATQEEVPVKATPSPLETPDLPGCFGNLNATFNHDSGIQDHGRDSKGPGYFFRDGQLFQEIRGEVWPIFCGPGAGTG